MHPMSRRPGADDAPGAAIHKRAEARRHGDARVDELRAVYHPGATERLRLRLLAELGRLHEERLRRLDRAGARTVLDEMRRIAFEHGSPRRLIPTPSRLVQEQGVRVGEAVVDAQRSACRARRYIEVDGLFLDLARLRRLAPDSEAMQRLWCEGLAWAHEASLATGRLVVAWARLEDLRDAARAVGAPGRDALARALADAHRDARQRRTVETADALLAELRGVAARALATSDQRAALCRALRCAHFHAGPGRRTALLQELAHWAHRPTATEEMRRDHEGAVATQRREAGQCDLPLSVLRSRAYRSEATTTDTEALFIRLESSLDEDSHDYADWATHLAELRQLAERADAPPRLRLRFARRWLGHRSDPRQRGVTDNDRASYQWALAAARRGDPLGQLLVGHCYREGRCVRSSRRLSTTWYRRAASGGSSEAEFWLRYAKPPGLRWLTYRGPWLTLAGFALLALHAAVDGPPHVAGLGVVLFVALQVIVQLGVGGAIRRLVPGAGDEDGWSSTRIVEYLRRRPWRLVFAAAEDGLVLVPILWLGVNPWTAALAGIVFALLHYPMFGWRNCVTKGIDYFVIALLFVPVFGVWTVAVGHIVFDGLVVLASARSRADA